VGASRKGFIGKLLAAAAGNGPGKEPGKEQGTPRTLALPISDRDQATVAITALAAATGAWCVRVHQVPPNVDAVRVAAAWRQASR
jgi:dihydropteroate synthase